MLKTRPYDWGPHPWGHLVSYRPYNSRGWPAVSWCEWIVPGTIDFTN